MMMFKLYQRLGLRFIVVQCSLVGAILFGAVQVSAEPLLKDEMPKEFWLYLAEFSDQDEFLDPDELQLISSDSQDNPKKSTASDSGASAKELEKVNIQTESEVASPSSSTTRSMLPTRRTMLPTSRTKVPTEATSL